MVDSVGAGRGIFLPTPIASENNYREVMSIDILSELIESRPPFQLKSLPLRVKEKKQRISLTMIETVGIVPVEKKQGQGL